MGLSEIFARRQLDIPTDPASATLTSSAVHSISPHNDIDGPDATTKAWHTRAWYVYDHVSEISQSASMTANTAALTQVLPGKKIGSHFVPIELDDNEPDDADDIMALDVGNECYEAIFGTSPSSVVFRLLVENLFVVGEGWLVFKPYLPGSKTKRLRDEVEVVPAMNIFSRGRSGMNPEVGYTDSEGVEHVFGPQDTAIRFMVPHPRKTSQPRSSVHAVLEEAECMLLLLQLINATGTSGIHSGILAIPEELVLITKREEFQTELVKGLSDPVVNPNSAATVAPHLFMGKGEFLEQIKHLALSRDFDEQLPLLIQRLEARVIRGLDLPAETIEGMGGTNHWSSWSINANYVRNHIQPILNVLLETLTRKVYWPKLIEAGLENYRKYAFTADTTNIAGQPNLAKNALDAYRLGVLSHEALLRHLGIPQEDIANPIRSPLGSTEVGDGGSDGGTGDEEKSTERKNGTNPDRVDEGGSNQPQQGEDKSE